MLVIGCSRAPAGDPSATLTFVRDGAKVKTMSLGELTTAVSPESFTTYDPYYEKRKSYRALPVRALLAAGFGPDAAFASHEYVLRAKDGYTVPLSGDRLWEEGAYLAFADADVPGWEPIGPQKANPGPFYLVWKGDKQQSLDSHPRPWQLATIEIARFETVFPLTVPEGHPEGSPARKGFAIFRGECIRCHAMNRQGGRVGPELNVPRSIVEYRPTAQIRDYVRNPAAFRYGNMPAHPQLSDGDLDSLIAYFEAMKSRKVDPGK
jgi:mono/diheme cytochrome c family protein